MIFGKTVQNGKKLQEKFFLGNWKYMKFETYQTFYGSPYPDYS